MDPTETTPRPLVVCDAGPLIHLDELGCQDLLSDFPAILIPDAVWNEVGMHRPGALSSPDVPWSRVTPLAPPPPELLALSQILSLHRGEWEALRISLDHPDAIFLADDTAARMAAANLGINAHGTIGVIVRAIRRHHAPAPAMILPESLKHSA